MSCWVEVVASRHSVSQEESCSLIQLFISCSTSWLGCQGLGGELAQHFSYGYVGVPGLRTAFGGQSRVWVPLAVSVCVVSVLSSSLRTAAGAKQSPAWYSERNDCLLLEFFCVKVPKSALLLPQLLLCKTGINRSAGMIN